MNDVVIHAASWLGPEGFGNDQTGLRAWPPPLKENLSRGELGGLHWSLLSDSDPSRFLRMDLMCRLGFMAAELLGVNFDAMPDARRDRLGVCVESFTGSLDTDIRFAQTPRPSIFAYTLPSTVVGEICIRFRLKGPVLSLISPDTKGAGAIAEAAEWLRNDDAEMALCLGIEAMNGQRRIPSRCRKIFCRVPGTARRCCSDVPKIRRAKSRSSPARLWMSAGNCVVADHRPITAQIFKDAACDSSYPSPIRWERVVEDRVRV